MLNQGDMHFIYKGLKETIFCGTPEILVLSQTQYVSTKTAGPPE